MTFFFILFCLIVQVYSTDPIAPVFSLGKMTAFGSGCDSKSVDIIDAHNPFHVSVRFDHYRAHTDSTHSRMRKACSVVIPVKVRKGFQISITRIEYEGSVYVPNDNGAKAVMRNEYFFAGEFGPIFEQVYERGTDKELKVANDVISQLQTWTKCGEPESFMRINSAITAKKKHLHSRDTQIDVDGMKYYKYFVAQRAC